MDIYTKEELKDALEIISSTIVNCEKMQIKFEEGTSQHTLLKNRIKALYISKALIIEENSIEQYTCEELQESLKPVLSIISKCEKALLKLKEGSAPYTRTKRIIKAMYISKSLIDHEIDKKN